MTAPQVRQSGHGTMERRGARRSLAPALLLGVILLAGGCTTAAPSPPPLRADAGTGPGPTLPATGERGAGHRDAPERDPELAVSRPGGTVPMVMPAAQLDTANVAWLATDPPDPPATPAPTARPTINPALPGPGASAPPDAWRVPVLTYHLVTATPPAWAGRDMTVAPDLLERHLQALQQAGWRTVTARDASDAMSAGDRLGPRSIIITFDDGYDDAWETALPLLRRYGFVATFFVLPGRFGQPWYLSTRHVAELAAAGMEVANHTWDHVDLSRESLPGAIDQLTRTNDAIERVTGVRPTTFAYPYGRFNETAVQAVAAAGLQMAFTTVGGCLEHPGNRLVMPRIRMNPWTSPDELVASLRPCTG